MTPAPRASRLRRLVTRLRDNRSGVAMLEFAFSAPLVLGIGCYGTELANLAMLNMRVSQIALNLADNASRVGAYSSLSNQQIREVDMNDVLFAARYQGQSINLTTNGRIIVSSLENVQQSYDKTAPVQRIHWQRCLGMKGSQTADSTYNSSYGTTSVTAGTTATLADAGTTVTSGMGDAGAQVNAPSGAGVMFIEVNYLTKPLFGTWLTQPQRIHYIASFVVRDRRDFTQIYNPSPTATASTCNLYTT